MLASAAYKAGGGATKPSSPANGSHGSRAATATTASGSATSQTVGRLASGLPRERQHRHVRQAQRAAVHAEHFAEVGAGAQHYDLGDVAEGAPAFAHPLL